MGLWIKETIPRDNPWETSPITTLASVLVLAAIAAPFLFPDSVHSASSPAVDQLVLGPKIQEELDFIKEETVVSAARYEQPISQAPSNVYVITAEDIRYSVATDIPTYAAFPG